MREAFSLLDRSSSNQVTRDDVADMLTNLSLPSSASEVTPFFPPGAPQTTALPTFLSTLSNLLAPLSGQEELLNAFAAFDERDSGEIDVGELRDAVMHTAPEPGQRSLSAREVEEALGGFVGRKAFGKDLKGGGAGGGRGEVFKYREWVGGVMGFGEEKREEEK
jgi:Ca2+-binding EF-hand superfamily protein